MCINNVFDNNRMQAWTHTQHMYVDCHFIFRGQIWYNFLPDAGAQQVFRGGGGRSFPKTLPVIMHNSLGNISSYASCGPIPNPLVVLFIIRSLLLDAWHRTKQLIIPLDGSQILHIQLDIETFNMKPLSTH